MHLVRQAGRKATRIRHADCDRRDAVRRQRIQQRVVVSATVAQAVAVSVEGQPRHQHQRPVQIRKRQGQTVLGRLLRAVWSRTQEHRAITRHQPEGQTPCRSAYRQGDPLVQCLPAPPQRQNVRLAPHGNIQADQSRCLPKRGGQQRPAQSIIGGGTLVLRQ